MAGNRSIQQLSSLDEADRRRVLETIRILKKIPIGGTTEAVFEALRRCVPLAGGIVGTMPCVDIDTIVTCAVELPRSVLDAWASTPRPHFMRMLAPFLGASAGELFPDSVSITGPFRKELAIIQHLHDAALGEGAGYKIGTRATFAGGLEHLFMTFALTRGMSFSALHHRLLLLVQPHVRDALERIKVPLVASQPLLAQVVAEQAIGYACTTREGKIVEMNRAAFDLVMKYCRELTAGGSETPSIASACARMGDGQRQRVHRRGDGSALEVFVHEIAKDVHLVHEDLRLIVLREHRPPGAGFPISLLTPRQQEVACMLGYGDLSYKQVANRLGIKEGTMRKHAENLYRRLKVRSRAELTVLLRSSGKFSL